MSIGAGKAMMTLDQRESKSSLAGVMMAAAMEGVGIYQFGEHVLPHIDDVPSAVGDVLSRVNLPAIPRSGALVGRRPTRPRRAPPARTPRAAEPARRRRRWRRAAAAAAAAPPEAAPPEEAAAEAGGGEGRRRPRRRPRRPRCRPSRRPRARRRRRSPRPSRRRPSAPRPSRRRSRRSRRRRRTSPTPAPCPTRARRAAAGRGGRQGRGRARRPRPRARPRPRRGGRARRARRDARGRGRAAAPPAAVEAAAGSGGGGDAAEALLQNKNLVLDADAQKDIRDGAVDPRMIGLLGQLTEKHKIELSVIKTGHGQFTSGGSVSNHFDGRGIDIAARRRRDRQLRQPGRARARVRDRGDDRRPAPDRGRHAVGDRGLRASSPTAATRTTSTSPSTASRPPGFKAPARGGARRRAPRRRAGRPVAAAAAAPGQPAAAAALAQPKAKPGDSISFKAVTAEDAAKAAGKKGDELSFMQPPAGPPSARRRGGPAPAVVADAATATAGGSSGLGAAALETAKAELAKGVKEEGVNTGTDVDKYLKEAGVAPGNPWCASFVTWALAQNGHKMEGGGWAGGADLGARRRGRQTNDLELVSAEDARPGDIVVYDWGGQEDFGADGHIGFVASDVKGGKFTALEGNNQDRVMTVPRDTSQANVKFIRIKGDAPAGAALRPRRSRPRPPARRLRRPPSSRAAAAAAGPARGRRDAGRRRRGRRRGRGRRRERREPLPRRRRAEGADRGLDGQGGREARPPPQLPIMASLVESGLTNIQGGDADSVGFFQMRVGIWNQGEYAGYPEKPELQVKWFLDQAEQVKKQRVAAGEPIDDPNSFGEWIADVERPAEQYRGRYQLKLGEANACSAAPPPRRPPAAPRPPRRARPARRAAAAVAQPKAKPGDSLSFTAVTAEDAAKAAAQEGRRAVLHEAAGGSRQRDRARRRHARRRGRRRDGDGGRLERPRRLGPGGREEGARRRREGGGHQHRREGRRVPGLRRRRPGQPVVRELRDVVAGEGRPQDGRAAAGPGCRRGSAPPRRRPTTSSSSTPRTRAPATSSSTTGAARRTSARTATSASWPATSKATSSPRWRATTRTR